MLEHVAHAGGPLDRDDVPGQRDQVAPEAVGREQGGGRGGVLVLEGRIERLQPLNDHSLSIPSGSVMSAQDKPAGEVEASPHPPAGSIHGALTVTTKRSPMNQDNSTRMLPLSAQELLTTTRSVRKRLDFTRPVDRDTLAECVRYALQAPSGSNRWPMQFVVVLEQEQRRRIGEIYARAYTLYRASEGYLGKVSKGEAERDAQQQRTRRLGRPPRRAHG